jgi:hypothetical protein
MDDHITLWGTIPGLLRRCSPVIGSGKFAGRRGVIVDAPLGGSHVVVAFEATATADASVEWLPRAELDLDLTDCTGREHGAIWLASFAWGMADVRSAVAVWLPHHNEPWLTIVHAGGRSARPLEGLGDLASLDRVRLLPDGSRWVDAEVLRRAGLQAHQPMTRATQRSSATPG